MSTLKHTPGPLIMRGGGNGYAMGFHVCAILSAATEHIATFKRPEDANLFMCAAELLAAANAIVELGNADCGTHWKIDTSDINRLRAAIAKAEGKP